MFWLGIFRFRLEKSLWRNGSVFTRTNSSQDRDGRMRIDETECPGGYSNGARIALWIKTHKEYYPVLIEKTVGVKINFY